MSVNFNWIGQNPQDINLDLILHVDPFLKRLWGKLEHFGGLSIMYY